MRVLWYSNAPWAPTGYGNQTALAVGALVAAGHEVAVLANYGLAGQSLSMGGIQVFPGGRDSYSNDVIGGTCEDFKADVLITLYDAWPLTFWKHEDFKTPWVAWAPVDHETMPPPVLKALKGANLPVAYSQHGEWAMKEAGLDPAYIPHGVDTDLFKPVGDTKEKLGFEADFLFGMIAANTGFPSRKSIPDVILAFSLFLQARPEVNAKLYLHMLTTQEKQGVNVWDIANSLGIKDNIVTCDQWQYSKSLPPGHLVDLYNAFDVLVNPSMGEGFGIPIVEALACGTPVIASQTTSMTELIGWNGDRGVLVETRPFWTQQGAWQGMPDHIGILKAMFDVADNGKGHFRGCRDFAVENYDFEAVVAPMWGKLIREEQWQK